MTIIYSVFSALFFLLKDFFLIFNFSWIFRSYRMKSAPYWSFEIWSSKRFRILNIKWHQFQHQIQSLEFRHHHWHQGTCFHWKVYWTNFYKKKIKRSVDRFVKCKLEVSVKMTSMVDCINMLDEIFIIIT